MPYGIRTLPVLLAQIPGNPRTSKINRYGIDFKLKAV